MPRLEHDVYDGEHWVPWVGLALVVPAVLVVLLGTFGVLSGGSSSGEQEAIGLAGAAVTGILACLGLMLGLVGLVRGVRRSAPKTGRSIGIAGVTLEIGVVVIAAAALVAVAFRLFL
jgi:hypothetical protein